MRGSRWGISSRSCGSAVRSKAIVSQQWECQEFNICVHQPVYFWVPGSQTGLKQTNCIVTASVDNTGCAACLLPWEQGLYLTCQGIWGEVDALEQVCISKSEFAPIQQLAPCSCGLVLRCDYTWWPGMPIWGFHVYDCSRSCWYGSTEQGERPPSRILCQGGSLDLGYALDAVGCHPLCWCGKWICRKWLT